jgi:transcriptional regulator with XRE-family HTH domain
MIMARGPRSQSRGLQALYDRYIGNDPAKVDAFEVAKSNAEVARCIYRLRSQAGLTQRNLAALVGTSPSVICRLEDADYDGHSLSMLKRIAAALGRDVQIRFTPRAVTARAAAKVAAPKTPKKAATHKTPKKKAAQSKSAHAKGMKKSRIKMR